MSSVSIPVGDVFASPVDELAEVRRVARQLEHPIVAHRLTGPVGDRVGTCFLCGRTIWETGDFRGDRFRHRPIDG